MTDAQVFTAFSTLPTDLKKEVKDFIAFLKTKQVKPKENKQRQFGSAKGFFIMHGDFDAPLEDFKDYM